MNVVVDKFGRILIPKNIRDEVGLTPGTQVDITTKKEHKVVLKVVEEESILEYEGNVLVVKGKLLGDPDKVLDEIRNEREQKIIESFYK